MPVCPICKLLSAYPLSTAALDAPIAAPKASAKGVKIDSKFSFVWIPLPPDTIFFADPRSGLSDLVNASPTHSDAFSGEAEVASYDTDSASVPDASAGWKDATNRYQLILSTKRSVSPVLTVKILIGSEDLTVARASPA